ncbi:hypothetical protein [uncultured Hymenobacter sp.]|uniref:hypothetical protein n=1 Tax=uncultured Hymenobacter sp. TaxID=170016 RepID=UPI0035CC85A6
MQLTRDTLKPFQLRAAGELTRMLTSFPSDEFKPHYDSDTAELYPFLCRLNAITGSGKTPMLAVAAAALGDAIILWTTNRGAVISQTATNLSAGGSYAALLPENAEVRELGRLTETEWSSIVEAKSGLTILLATVALFNQDPAGESLNVHRERGGTSYWEMLAGRGPQARHRPLYVVYDEAHGATNNQFTRLTELRPRAFVLASASPLPPALVELMPGKTGPEKAAAQARQTVKVNTTEVVEAGLLKTRLYLVDCNTTRSDAVKDSNDKWVELSRKLPASASQSPIWCGVVNSTLAGLEVWEILTRDLGVGPERIAVHLSSIDKAMRDANPSVNWNPLIDTHKAKKTPESLRADGYTHIIWNLSLREGWDEPWAYVAYLDGIGKSMVDISQKIGRFVRQPNATPFADGDLNSAYFYFNVPDEDFTSLVRATQQEMEREGYEIIALNNRGGKVPPSRLVPTREERKIPQVLESFGQDLAALDKVLTDHVPLFAPEDLRAPGRVKTRVFDMHRNAEDGSLQKEEKRTDNAEIRVWNYLLERLNATDGRIVRPNSTCFSHDIKDEKALKQKMQYGSRAMLTINRNLSLVEQELNGYFRLEYEPDDPYELKPFNLVAPNLAVDDTAKRAKYQVRTYQNALHAEYNGLNRFEVLVADALDNLGLDWCRNPAQTGYYIPIAEIGEGTTKFFPDFLLWTKKCLWAIDPKGPHITNDAIHNKLLGVSDVDGMPLKVRVALILEGRYVLGHNYRPHRQGSDGYTLIIKEGGMPRSNRYDSLDSLVAALK